MKLLLTCLLLLCFSSTNARVLTIGTTSDNPPFASLADNQGHFYGFEIDIMMEVCKRINTECKFKGIVVSNAREVLSEGNVDLIIAGIIAPPADTTDGMTFLFSESYQASSGQFITGIQSNINTLGDIRNKSIGTRFGSLFGGTFFQSFVLKMYDNQVTTKLFLTMNDLFAALATADVEVVFSNAEAVQYFNTNNKGRFQLIGKPIPIGNGYSIMGKKSDPELMSQINQALNAMESDGTYITLYNRYFAPM